MLYVRAKELSCVHIFENCSSLSKIQLEFLYWIALYNRLYQDIAMGEKYISEDIIKDDFLCDCYLIWEEKVKRKQELNKTDKLPAKRGKKQIDYRSSTPSVVFTK